MKKIYRLVLCVILLVLFTACSKDEWVQDMETVNTEETTAPVEFEFKGIENETFYFCIEKYTGDDDHIILPTQYRGYKVCAIGDSVFFGSKAKSVVIPDGTLEIGTYAFAYSQFESIELPNTLETIGNNCFQGAKIREIRIPAGIKTIDFGLFYNCRDLETVILPTTIEECRSSAFEGCDNLKTIHFSGPISERDARKVFKSFENLPKGCVLTMQDSHGNTVILHDDNVQKEEHTESNKITVEKMKNGVPYLLLDGEIQSINQIEVYRGTISEQQIDNIPKVSKNAKIIVKTEKNNLGKISVSRMIISPEESGYVNSTDIDFAYKDGKVYLNLQTGTYEVDSIAGKKQFKEMPLIHNDRFASGVNSYVLHSLSGAAKYVVGYWKGTQYEETEIEVSYARIKYDKEVKYTCELTKTYDGYFIVDLPKIATGYYHISGFRNENNYSESYVLYFE